jgi:phage host-nuclease inhibitor protein Gam
LADVLLSNIRDMQEEIDKIKREANDAIEAAIAQYSEQQAAFAANLKGLEKMLIALMKKECKTFFDGTDVLQLENGALIHETSDHVTIPRDALGKCKKLGFSDVIKIAESLDREAVEKWTTEKLLLIGAERKPVETFSYDLKKSTDCHSREERESRRGRKV